MALPRHHPHVDDPDAGMPVRARGLLGWPERNNPWPIDAEDLWSLQFRAPVRGTEEQIAIYGIARDDAELEMAKWMGGQLGNLGIELPADRPDDIREQYAQGWPYRDIREMRMMPMREAL